MPSEVFLGVDVGGTKTRVAAIDSGGRALLVGEVLTAAEGGADPGLMRSWELARDLIDQAAQRGLEVRGIGVGVPEYVDSDGLLRSRDVVAWDRQPREVFADLGPVTVESDVRCGAFAEACMGIGQGADSMLYASIGTGISCAFVLEGQPWSGHRGEAIALGELPIDPSLDAGTARSLEEFASGSGIARRYSRLTGQQVMGARDVIERADSGDPRAARVVESAAVALGSALAWAVHLLDPQVVVLGGGLGTSGGEWARAVTDAYTHRSRPEAPAVVAAAMGANSGVVGAALIAGSAILG